ncbi:MAG TPA: winged helix-turn-helix domain-containing protein, partial [Pyrinomonadaceae bacterium]|nr:winged helix-turn-helix domain-containing protein [Pyrinomonadaceae bacterium]
MEKLKEMRAYTFGPFLLDETMRRLSRGGEVVHLTTKLFDILLLLVKNHGQVVTKENLLSEIWPDSFVEENNLTVAVSALRKLLGETPKEHVYIETVPKQGYRFVALVNETIEGSAPHNSFERNQASSEILIKENEPTISLAVLPLVNTNNDSEIDYLSDGIAESIINCFSKLPRLKVMAYSTVARYKGQDVDPRRAGRELGVRAVLRGNIRHLGDRIVIGMELIDVNDGTQLWGEQYKLQFSNIFEVQEKIINEVSNNLFLRLTLEEKRQLRPDRTVNSEAYRHYLKGRYFMGKRTVSNIMKGIEYFYKAIGEDEDYAQA